MFLTMLMVGFFSPYLLAQQKNDVLQQLQAKLTDSEQRNQAISAGMDRALLCGYCHGSDGNSIRSEVPNLAGQNPDYLLQQVNHFSTGERKDFVMNSLASKFTLDDQINLTIFYASQEVKPVYVNRVRASKGKPIYIQRCQSCHGETGRGNTGYARLAGQQTDYIKMTLLRFRENAKGKSTDHRRRSEIMESLSASLTDQEIQNLAAYISSM